jgi:membrane associated rhomboid family serine protease
MSVGDLVGSIGVAILLLAFGLNITGQLGSHSHVYLSLNFLGAALACVASILISYVPFVILEGAWSAVAAGTLLQTYRRNRRRY